MDAVTQGVASLALGYVVLGLQPVFAQIRNYIVYILALTSPSMPSRL